ncbi:MAG: toll/interleukin-1 receptor domain-containing protein, partial [Anaerolineae bacterium]|nr:toll/interleukin-1 receptor domain-containing protein [Anaerolineae bacterium]
MRLFISYARVDKYYCAQIMEVLSAHDLWIDNRLQAGKSWWDEIQRRLEWCEGFVYLLSPESVSSTYCRREYEIAKALGRPIFPILIHARTQLPDDLADMHYVDLSAGVTIDAVKLILDSIYLADHTRQPMPAPDPVGIASTAFPPDQPSSVQDAEYLVQEAIEAFDTKQYDRAVFLLKQAKTSGYVTFIDLDSLLH